MKRLFGLCIAGLLLFMTTAWAAAPFPGGEVTSPFGEENHFGHTH